MKFDKLADVTSKQKESDVDLNVTHDFGHIWWCIDQSVVTIDKCVLSCPCAMSLLKVENIADECSLNDVISSPEPSGSQGELIVYSCSGVCCCRHRCCRRQQCLNIFSYETALPKPNCMWSLLGKGEQKFI